MPNGGPDCCGTCWFNSANEGEPGYREGPLPEEVHCTIRALKIETPFWTYCANHPDHNPDRVEIPIGPVYVADDYPYTRRVLCKSPDNEGIRVQLLELLERMQERPRVELLTPTMLDEEVIKQLMEFRETRAAPALRRIARFNPLATPPRGKPFRRNRVATVALAVEALACTETDRALDVIAMSLRCGLSDVEGEQDSKGVLVRLRERGARREANHDDQGGDPMSIIRYHAVLGLKHCTSDSAKDLLREAANDPHPEVAALARAVLSTNKDDT